MSIIRKIGAFLSVICMIGMLIPSSVYAASASVNVSSASGNKGSTVTINCTASVSGTSIGSADVTLEYPDSALTVVSCSSGASGSSGRVYYSNYATNDGQSSLSFSVTFRIEKEGTFAVKVTNYDVSDFDAGASIVASVSNGSVTGKAVTSNSNSNSNNTNQQDTRDKNSKLSNLQVSPGTLSPVFNAGTTSYTVTVPEDTTEVTIGATAQSNKASVAVSGGKDIKLGENLAKVVVTAENGSTTVYNLTIICGEKEKISVNGTDNTINEDFTDEEIPTGFVREKIVYNEREYEALKHEISGMQLINLQNEAGNTFYIFNVETQEFYNFAQISFSEGRYIIPLVLDDTEEFTDYETTTITLQDKSFDAWKVDEDYSVIRVMNHEGEIVLYQYDSLDGTLQRYAGAVAKEIVEEPQETEMTFFSFLEKYYLYIIAGLGVLVLVLIIALICVAVKKRNKSKDEYDFSEKDFYVEPIRVESRKQPKEVEEQPKKKKRKHDARRRKVIKRLEKQRMKENR